MDVNVDLAHLVGIKLSATQLNLVTTDMRARILSDRVIPLTDTDAFSVTEVIAHAVEEEVMADPAIRVVGISLAGPVSPRSEVVRVSPFLDWSDVPLVDMIQQPHRFAHRGGERCSCLDRRRALVRGCRRMQ